MTLAKHNEYQGVLFDYNGVIVNDEHIHDLAFSVVLRQYGLTLTPSLYSTHCLGRTDAEGFQNLASFFVDKLPQLSVDHLVAQKQRAYQELVAEHDILYPGSIPALNTLSQRFKLAIVTSSTRAEVQPVLESAGISSLFHDVITADDIRKGKPDPEGYLKGLAALDLPRERVVVVEDAPSGIRAANAAGLKCIAVEHTTSAENLVGADVVVKNIADITPKLLGQLLNCDEA